MVVQAWASTNSEFEKYTGFGKRHTFALLAFVGICLSYAMRFNLSIVIIVMVNSTVTKISAIDLDTTTDEDNENSNKTQSGPLAKAQVPSYSCPAKEISSNSSNGNLLKGQIGKLNWDEGTVGLILGSFFWGYLVTQVPGGVLAQRFGGSRPFGVSQLISALAGFFIPLSSLAGPYFLIVIRVIQGLSGGITIPASHVLISKWVPVEERAKLTNFIYAGIPFGSAATLLISGFIAHFLGWAMVFYITGVITVIWTALWFWLIYDTPSLHPTISDEELKYIESSIGSQGNKKSEHLRTPWREIFKSVPMWALAISHPACTWGHYTLLILIPTYLKTALNFDIQSNSLISTLPHLTSWVMSMIIIQFGQFLQHRNIASVGIVRKINMTITLWGSAACMIGVAFAGCNYMLAVSLLILAVGCIGGVYGGLLCNHIDIAPNFAGLLLGLTNTLATVPGFLSPSIAGYILQGNTSVVQWRKIFFLGAAIHIVGNIFYLIFGAATVQPWNNGAKRKSSPNAIDVIT